MSWFKKVIKQFIKEDHEEMEPFEAAEKQEDPLIRNEWNNEWKKEEDSKIIYKYPKGKFRFPVISDEEIGIPGRQSRQDHQAERRQNAQASERQEPAQAGRQSGQGYTEQQEHTVEKRQNAVTYTGRQEQSLNSNQHAPTNSGRQERQNERRQNVSVNKGMQEVQSDRRHPNRQEISNNRRTSSQAIHSRLKPRELPEESTPNPKSYQSKMPFKPTEIPSPIYGYNNRPKVDEKPKEEVVRTKKIDSSDFLTSVMRRKEAAEQAALRAELQKEESKESKFSEQSGTAETKMESNISNARDIEQIPKEIALNTEASVLNKATVQNSIPAVYSSEEELQPAFIMEETEELNSLIQHEPIVSLVVEEKTQPQEAEDVMYAASTVVYELEEEPLLQEEEKTSAKVDVILPQEEKLYVEPAEVVELEEEPLLQEEEKTSAKVDVMLPQEEKLHIEPAEVVELEEEPLLQEEEKTSAKVDVMLPQEEKLHVEPAEVVELEERYSTKAESSLQFEELPVIEESAVMLKMEETANSIEEKLDFAVNENIQMEVEQSNHSVVSSEWTEEQPSIEKTEVTAVATTVAKQEQKDVEEIKEPQNAPVKKRALPFNVLMLNTDRKSLETKRKEQQIKKREQATQSITESAAASEAVYRVQEEQAAMSEPIVQVQEEQAVLSEPVVRVQEEQAAVSEPVVRVQEEQAVLSEPVVRVQEEQVAVSEPVVRVQEEQAVLSEPVVRVQEEQVAVSEPVVRVQEEQAVLSEPVVDELPYYVFPEDELLSPPIYNTEHDGWIEEQTELLNHTFKNFNVHAKVVNVTQGPSVTRYEVQPEPGVKVSKITNLSDDLKLSLAAKDIRIEAPIPGKHTIGIEVPNRTSRPVLLSEILNSEEFKDSASPLTVALGLDISGKPIVTDLRKMPHGLIAGATGSGKSVCINTMLVSLLYKAKPEDLKLLLIDPKMVELAPYNYIPHLASPVITDVKTATAALKWAVEEMERRYELLAHAGVRDITKFNQLAEQNQQYAQKLPYIVIIIDELADLMMMAPADVEEAISRIAQKARACGIHLLIATQRPSVDVITGLIKANVPTRIAFSVSSQIDSRTVIDISGAEKLLGKGDMLFLENGTSKPVRLQGTFVSDEEIDQVVAHARRERKPDYLFEQEELLKKVQMSEDEDELFYEACEFIIEQGGASTSSLQRNFKIGYNRAARLIDMMEKQGYISEAKGTKPRDVLITEVEFLQLHDTEQH
ncbi:FtsK/SpoIIIE domain-containing protein [Niallia taxi]|uniref:DNA translocase FtsK n=2 Tax=Niallia taxi TaxID=2499688 RepID=UPI0021A51EFA|nr:DNA translocase FtsK [Niallia taxi]MCT2346654.1 FtsK/SpoIIIE domain-containing protein [Niallia taxi]